MRRLPGPAGCRLSEGDKFSGGSRRIVSGLAENTDSIFCDGSAEPEAANGCPVLLKAGTTSREAPTRTATPDTTHCAFSRTRPEHLCLPLTNDVHGGPFCTRRSHAGRFGGLKRAQLRSRFGDGGAQTGGVGGEPRNRCDLDNEISTPTQVLPEDRDTRERGCVTGLDILGHSLKTMVSFPSCSLRALCSREIFREVTFDVYQLMNRLLASFRGPIRRGARGESGGMFALPVPAPTDSHEVLSLTPTLSDPDPPSVFFPLPRTLSLRFSPMHARPGSHRSSITDLPLGRVRAVRAPPREAGSRARRAEGPRNRGRDPGPGRDGRDREGRGALVTGPRAGDLCCPVRKARGVV
jgi:hypothetical protein